MYQCPRKSLTGFSLLLLWIARPCQAITVATAGDSFADALYNAMRARPDLMRQYDVQLMRWSRPIIGLTRTDYFDYTGWLRNSPGLGAADVCFAQIGSNDMQSIPVAKNQWIAYGSPQWREAYAGRTREMAQILIGRCRLLIWVLQPGFEKKDSMACHRELINEVERGALRLERTRVLEIATSAADYGVDRTHFNRAYVLDLGPALFHLIDTSRQILHSGCLACHRNVEGLALDSGIAPLRPWHGERVTPVWAPERVGVECRMAAPRRIAMRSWRRRRLAR